MKYILLIGDGMGDSPVPELGHRTPLEAAHKPTIDRLCAASEALLVRTVPEGYPPGSDVANLSLLGYEPQNCYTGRAPLEAASMGLEVPEQGAAFRCNLVTVSEGQGGQLTMVDYSAGHISTAEAQDLVATLQEHCGTDTLHLYPGVGYRHLLMHQGPVPHNLHTVPPHDWMDKDVTSFYEQYLRDQVLACLIQSSKEVLAHHPVNARRLAAGKLPANSLWLWGEGGKPVMNTLKERYGVSGSLISAVDLLKGIGVCSGLEVPHVEGATGYLDTNYQGKVDAALSALEHQDFVVVHIEAPDEAGHQGSVKDKVQAIEDFDAKVVAPLAEELHRRAEAHRIVVTMDHYTPLAKRTHEDWPVPMFIYDSRGTACPAGCAYTEAGIKALVARKGLYLDSGAAFFAHFLEVPQNG
jgi:2,3-bisphosphoglycerate-independent phosphoglycerate mutase